MLNEDCRCLQSLSGLQLVQWQVHDDTNAERKFHVQLNFERWDVGGQSVRRCHSLQSLGEDMDVVEKFDPMAHEPLVSKVMPGKVRNIRTCEVPQAVPGVSGRQLPGGKELCG